MVIIGEEGSGEFTDYGDSSQNSGSGNSVVQNIGQYGASAAGAGTFAAVGSKIADQLKSIAPNNSVWQNTVQYGPVFGPLKSWLID